MSRDLHVDTATETIKLQVTPALFIKGEFDGGDLRLWSGVGEYTFNSEVYTGGGTLIGISELRETTSIEAQGASFILNGLNSAVISVALNENYSGRRITVWKAFLDSSNSIVGSAIMLGRFRADVLQIDNSGDSATLTMQAESELIDFQRARVRRYTAEDQKTDYPSDLGLDFVADLQDREINWGRPSKK